MGFASFSVDCAMNPIAENERSGHIGILPLTNKTEQPRKDCAVFHNLLNCSYSLTFEDVSVLCH